MRKSILLALGIAAMSMAGAATVDAAVKTYWDQSAGKWMKYDTNARRVSPLSGDSGATTNMGKVQAFRGGSKIPRQTIDYSGPFRANTIVINTAERRLYYVLPDGKALKYGVGVGREGFQWSGVELISRKAEWPGWTPPPEMIARERKKGRILPAYMEGGPNNPLGARAMYIGGTLYRIHGSNEPWTMGQAVSSGCIRMTNEDVTHLYERVKIGTRVVVLRGDESATRLAALANPPPPKKEIVVADARIKDDALVSIGIGLGVAVAGTVPTDEVAPVTAVVVVSPEGEVLSPAVAAVAPEARTKDDAIVAVPLIAAIDDAEADESAAPTASIAAAGDLPLDESAKDDSLAAVPVPTAADEPIAETAAVDEVVPVEPEQGDGPAALEADATPVEALPSDAAAKDDGLTTDLSGGAVPIEGAPDIADDKAARNTAVEDQVVAN